MPVKTEVDQEKQLTIKTVTGSPSFEESMLAFRQFYEGELTQKVLWDFRTASLSEISSNHIEKILNYIQQHAEKRAGGKTAILVLKELEYGLSRMIQTLSECKAIPLEVEIFRSIEAALQWLEV
jgi:hypothetical protein